MAEVTNERMYKQPKPVHRYTVRPGSVRGKVGRELAPVRRSIGGLRSELHAIVARLEPAEPQTHQVPL